MPPSPPVLPVSVVVPTFNRPDLVRQLVRSILDGDHLPAEIVVADQSPGQVPPMPSHDDVDVVHLRLARRGASRGRNAGLAAARHDVLVFADDDVVVEPDWLHHLVDALLAAPARAVVTGSVLSGGAPGFTPSLTRRTEPEVFAGRPKLDPLFTGNMAARRQAFDDVGLFDERLGGGARFPAAEDNDLGFRLLESGYRIELVPGAVVRHFGARTGRQRAALKWAYGLGQGAFYAKHLRVSDRYMLRRLRHDLGVHARRVPPVIRGDRAAMRDAIYSAGVVAGAIGWLVRHGRGSR